MLRQSLVFFSRWWWYVPRRVLEHVLWPKDGNRLHEWPLSIYVSWRKLLPENSTFREDLSIETSVQLQAGVCTSRADSSTFSVGQVLQALFLLDACVHLGTWKQKSEVSRSGFSDKGFPVSVIGGSTVNVHVQLAAIVLEVSLRSGSLQLR